MHLSFGLAGREGAKGRAGRDCDRFAPALGAEPRCFGFMACTGGLDAPQPPGEATIGRSAEGRASAGTEAGAVTRAREPSASEGMGASGSSAPPSVPVSLGREASEKRLVSPQASQGALFQLDNALTADAEGAGDGLVSHRRGTPSSDVPFRMRDSSQARHTRKTGCETSGEPQ
jgi:hypothetical protein